MANLQKLVSMIKESFVEIVSGVEPDGDLLESLGNELQLLLKSNDSELMESVLKNLDPDEVSFFEVSIKNIASSSHSVMINNSRYMITPLFIPFFISSDKRQSNVTKLNNIDKFLKDLKSSSIISSTDFVFPVNALLSLSAISEITSFDIYNLTKSLAECIVSNNYTRIENLSSEIIKRIKMKTDNQVIAVQSEKMTFLYSRVICLLYVKNVDERSVLTELSSSGENFDDDMNFDEKQFQQDFLVYNNLSEMIAKQLQDINEGISIDIPSYYSEVLDNTYMFYYKMSLPIQIANGKSHEIHLKINEETNRLCLIYENIIVDQPMSVDFEDFIFEAEEIEEQSNVYRDSNKLELVELIIDPDVAKQMQEISAEYDEDL